MAGLAPISFQQFINPSTGRAYSGARAAFYEASTNNPITVYRDYGLGSSHPNPVSADSSGRFPAIFIDEAVEFYRLRLTTSTGVVIPLGVDGNFDIPVLPVVGPTSGAGGGSDVPVDPNAIFTTGDVTWSPKAGTKDGWVRINGRTAGSASSGASERANDDVEDLYSYIWANFADSICPVVGGRGISAAADFAANKPITLLDMRSRSPFGLDDMGNSALSAFTGITFTKGTATTGGASAGVVRHTLVEAELPSVTMNVPAQQPTFTYSTNSGVQSGGGTSAVGAIGDGNDYGNAVTPTGDATPGTVSFGSGNAHNNMPPFVLGTFLWKL